MTLNNQFGKKSLYNQLWAKGAFDFGYKIIFLEVLLLEILFLNIINIVFGTHFFNLKIKNAKL